MSEDTILIEEYEEVPMCDCDCLYDLDIEISSLPAGRYVININEPYVNDHERLIFKIDLLKEREGSFCIVRKGYPWGISIN